MNGALLNSFYDFFDDKVDALMDEERTAWNDAMVDNVLLDCSIRIYSMFLTIMPLKEIIYCSVNHERIDYLKFAGYDINVHHSSHSDAQTH